MTDHTILLDRLSIEEVSKLKTELFNNCYWQNHFDTDFYRKLGALRNGKTTWVMRTDDYLNCTLDATENFPVLMNIVKKYSVKLGRIYYHKLDPTENIFPHTDSGVKFIDKISNRFQIYLDIPSKVDIFLDNRIFNASEIEFGIVKFALKKLHWYKNSSSEPLIFCVFDALKD